MLNNLQRSAERAAFRKPNSGSRGPGRPPATDIPLEELFKEEDEVQKANVIQRRGMLEFLPLRLKSRICLIINLVKKWYKWYTKK